MNKVS